jgi:hypothetical protein
VPTAAISWDIQRVFVVPGRKGIGIMGRAFDLLPGGTMFSASCIYRGIIGVRVKMLSDTKAQVINYEPVIMTRENTSPEDLEPWAEELLLSFELQPA